MELTPGAEWTNVWEQTETTALGSATQPVCTPQLLTAPDPIGFAESPVELRLVDELMNDVPEGEPGELAVRGPFVTPGYFEDDEANTAISRSERLGVLPRS